MKKIGLILSLLGIFCSSAFTQKVDSITVNKLTAKDSLIFEYLDEYHVQLREPKYKLYPTTNMWTFLKLNTATGQIWQVQYSIDDNKRFEYILDTKRRLNEWDESICGRFELHPTQNRNTFILLDNINGRCWQVQWSIDDDSRFVLPIY